MDIKDDSIYFGDGVDQFSMDNESCPRWILFDKKYSNVSVTSKSSSVIFIFSTGNSNVGHGFDIGLEPISLREDRIHLAGGKMLTL